MPIMPTERLLLVPHPSSMFATYQPALRSRTRFDGVVRKAAEAHVQSCLRIMMAREAVSPDRQRARLRRCIESDAEAFFVAEVDGG
jgi:hypothetical protein